MDRDRADDLRFLLRTSLEAGVPLLIAELRTLPEPERTARMLGWARDGAQQIAHKGDLLQFGGKGTGAAWSAMARGIAAASFAPGGITVFGAHFCADHDQCLTSNAQR